MNWHQLYHERLAGSIKSVIYIIVIGGFFISCDKLLDIEAEGTINGNIFDNQQNIEKALIGAYYGFGGINDGAVGGELMGGDLTLIPTLLARRNNQEISWDDVNGGQYSNFMDKNILATNDRVQANWRRGYEVINTVNNIISSIDNISDVNSKNRILGEALAMRGILYFEMVRLWGSQYDALTLDVESLPLRTEPIIEVNQIKTPELSTIKEVYSQAEQDLTSASTFLEPFGKNDFRLSYYACQAYLMRLNMQKRNYLEAEIFASTIINSSEFHLATSPVEAFNNITNSVEDIFAVQQTLSNSAGDKSTGSGLPNFYSSLAQSGLGVMRIFEFSLISPFQANGPKFSNQDLRGVIDRNVDLTTTEEQITTPFYTNVLNTSLLSSSKFKAADRVIPRIRLAEIYLSRAEILYEKNIKVINPMALSDLNMIRNRAGLSTLAETDFITSFSFYDSLIIERKRELIYEGILFHDLKRWKQRIGANVATSSKFVLPIPQSETDTWTN